MLSRLVICEKAVGTPNLLADLTIEFLTFHEVSFFEMWVRFEWEAALVYKIRKVGVVFVCLRIERGGE